MRPETVNSAALLREARLRAGMSQELLGAKTHRPRPQIARWEAGAVAPSLDTLLELVRACGFDIRLELVEPPALAEDRLRRLQALSPEKRVDFMLKRSAEQE